MRKRIKRIVKNGLPVVVLNQNQRYERQAEKVIRRVCNSQSNCIDVGAYKGDTLDMIFRFAPQGRHHAFEPSPVLHKGLKVRFYDKENCSFYDLALSNEKGEQSLTVFEKARRGGLLKKKKAPEATDLNVNVDRLDDIIAENEKIDFIKIDVDGGEWLVMQGGKNIIAGHKPVVIFEHKPEKASQYDTTPENIYDTLQDCGMQVSQMIRWLKQRPPLSKEEFIDMCTDSKEYYFIAYP